MIWNKKLSIVFICIVSLACISVYFSGIKVSGWNNGFNNGFANVGCDTEDITDMYENYIENWKQEVSLAFDSAESKILDTKPDDIVGPDPDPKKCICGGSGWILQGDGHKTPCPYHGKQTMDNILKENNLIYKPLLILV